MWPFKSKIEKRAANSGYTAEIIAARESYISGNRGIAELTGTAQAAISLWEGGLALAGVSGTEMLTPRCLALSGRSMALRGEALFLIRDNVLVPCADWDVSTRFAKPTAYRVSISEAGGGRTQTALAGEVFHFRTGCDVATPYYGQAPLKRASLTAGLLNAVETALTEVFEFAALGSTIVPMPEMAKEDMQEFSRSVRGERGKIFMRESARVTAAGGPSPASDLNPNNLSPDISKAMSTQTLQEARTAVSMAFGVLPSVSNSTTTGPLVREAQRHLAQWILQPIAAGMAEEATDKLEIPVTIDVMQPLQAFDAGGRARSFKAVVDAMVAAKAGGVDTAEIQNALKLVNWDNP